MAFTYHNLKRVPVQSDKKGQGGYQNIVSPLLPYSQDQPTTANYVQLKKLITGKKRKGFYDKENNCS